MSTKIKGAISKLTEGKNLSFQETKEIFQEIFEHKTTPSQIAAFLTSLKMKGETELEISAAATVIREKATKIDVRNSFVGIRDKDEAIIDTCGTGGSGLNKFNISTAVAFVVSSAGIKVAKHGNKAMSSSCGSADVLEVLGINITAASAIMEKAVREVGIGFLYAPLYHPALKEVAQIRRELGLRTIFNILGPLCNPAEANYQLLGVYSKNLVSIMARVLKKLGLKAALVIHSEDLKDEVSLSSPTYASFLNKRRVTNFVLRPSSFGLKKIAIKDLLVKDVKTSALILKEVFEGKPGAPRDIVLANASACFYILGKVNNFKEGVALAAKMIDEHKVKNKFLQFKQFLEKNA